MSIRLRKLIGTVLLLVLLTVWAFLAMVLAQMPVVADSRLAQLIYYVVAGLGWVLPAMPLVTWMSRPDR